jgi:hypothetical protein
LELLRGEVTDAKSQVFAWMFCFVRDMWLVTITRDVQLSRKSVKQFLAESVKHVGSFNFDDMLSGDDVPKKVADAIASEAASSIKTLGQQWTTLRSEAATLVEFVADAMPKLMVGTQVSACCDTLKDAADNLKADLSSETASKFSLALGSLTGLQTCFKEIDEAARPKLAQRCLFLMKQTAVMQCHPRVTALLEKASTGK